MIGGADLRFRRIFDGGVRVETAVGSSGSESRGTTTQFWLILHSCGISSMSNAGVRGWSSEGRSLRKGRNNFGPRGKSVSGPVAGGGEGEVRAFDQDHALRRGPSSALESVLLPSHCRFFRRERRPCCLAASSARSVQSTSAFHTPSQPPVQVHPPSA